MFNFIPFAGSGGKWQTYIAAPILPFVVQEYQFTGLILPFIIWEFL